MNKSEGGKWHLAFVVGELKEGDIEPTTKIHALKPICYEQFELDRAAISEYHNSLKLIKSVQLNIQEFLQSIVSYTADFLESKDMSEEKYDVISLNFSRQLLNILSMFRSLLDHSDFSLSRRFGKGSKELEQWKSIQSKQYDDFFEYRLFYKLRNYCQHIGIPPLQISFTDSVEQEGISFRLDLQTERLLEEKSVWNKLLIQDLESAPQKIPVIDSLNNWSACFQAISKTLLEIKRESALDAANRVLAYRVEHQLPTDVGQLCAVFLPLTDSKPNSLKLTLSWAPESKAFEMLNINPFQTAETAA
ncbi:hypothetical protein CWO17_15520 [Vibrio sp. 10N.286.45.A3]|uniref:hypothetical protein n=1 Tax=Vibrio TaxID=662 RepID=UPI000D349060|nr:MULTISPECIES: hypothetical protein [Vibrio]PTP01503.1 hypothetical protein CWO17_15520 [Vibrio sp. 10N.286.45.A3]TKE82361.1 hypothetical protein FCV56_12510 [Vibrio sp. F12]TKE98187.1 hypothetical protein FCV61_11910 [Vibrio sp. F12]TKF95745.1 hypothetical protein FCV71_15410 [Vibrio lentus]